MFSNLRRRRITARHRQTTPRRTSPRRLRSRIPAPRRTFHGRRRFRSGREAGAALLPPGPDDRPAGAGPHPGPEAVPHGSPPLVRLVRALQLLPPRPRGLLALGGASGGIENQIRRRAAAEHPRRCRYHDKARHDPGANRAGTGVRAQRDHDTSRRPLSTRTPKPALPSLWMNPGLVPPPVLACGDSGPVPGCQSRGGPPPTGGRRLPDTRRLPGVEVLCGHPQVWMVLWMIRMAREDGLT